MSREFTVGDTFTSLAAKLYRPNGDPIILGPSETVTFTMVSSAGSVKINNQPATIVSRGDAVAGTPAEVRYDWGAGDVDTAGEFFGSFIRNSGGVTEHFPVQDPDNPEFQIIFWATT